MVSWRAAEITPTGIAISRATVRPSTASSKVTGSRWPISSSTGRFVHSDSPRSPRATLLSHSTYCTGSGRLRPSFSRSSSRSLAYAFSASISTTTSPGISRGSVKTISDAISSEGIAMSRRFARYRLSTTGRRDSSPVEPRRHEPAAVVVAHVRPVVLERALPDRDVDAGRHLHVVLLLGQVALDVVDDLAALGDVGRAPLADQHVGHHRVVDVALVLELFRVVLAEQEVVRLQEPRLGPEGHRLELAVEARRDVRAVLFLVDLDVDADRLQVLLHELHRVDQDRRAVGREAHGSGETVGIAGGGQQPLGFGRIVLVVLGPVAQLVERDGPLPERGRHRRIHGANALEHRVDDCLAIDG